MRRRPGQIDILREGEGVGAASSPAAPSSGAAASPAAAPASPAGGSSPSEPSTPSGAPSESGGADAFDFNSILDGSGELAGEASLVPAPAPAAVAPQDPGVAQPAAPATPAPPVPPAPTAAPAEKPTGQQAPLSPAEPEQLARALAANEAAVVDHLSGTVFALTPEEISGLEENAVAVIPKLMAKAFVQSQKTMLQTLANSVPKMIGQHLKNTAKHDANASKFYSAWPDISKEQHGDLVNRLASLYRQMNPNATLDGMIADLGPLVMMQAKIVPGSAARQPGAPRPAATNGVKPVPASPFVPAAGSAAAAMTQQDEGNPWDILNPNNPLA